MIRWCPVAVAVVALGLMPGCGLGVRKLDRETMASMATVARNYPEPAHRVAVAALVAMRAELASADFARDSEFLAAPLKRKPDGSTPGEGEARLPPDGPAFWVEWTNKGQTFHELMTLRACHFRGKTRDGRPVEVAVLVQPEGTTVTVLVDKLGDRTASRALLDRIADRLAHPAFTPGTPEEAAMLKAFFGGVESREALPFLRQPGAAGCNQFLWW